MDGLGETSLSLERKVKKFAIWRRQVDAVRDDESNMIRLLCSDIDVEWLLANKLEVFCSYSFQLDCECGFYFFMVVWCF